MYETPGSDFDPAKDIFATTKYAPRTPGTREFVAWHRPRKHFVRRDQWTKQILDLYTDRPLEHPFRYLGLPGADLLDLRYFHTQVCAPTGREMRFLGFNRSASAESPEQLELNVSLDEVARLAGLDPQSVVLGDDFRMLSSERSIAWKKAKALGPFDVVNLDLCDGIAAEPPHERSIYEAINCLMSLQARTQHPWLLFITSRIGKGHIDDEAFESLTNALDENLARCSPFADSYRAEFGIDDPAAGLRDLDARRFFYGVVAALCKWLLARSHAAARSKVTLKSCISYRVEASAECDDLVSIALRIDPVIAPMPDPTGLALSGNAPTDEDCAQAAKMPTRIAKVVLADQLLETNAELTQELITEMEDLLVAARYEATAYRRWLEEQTS